MKKIVQGFQYFLKNAFSFIINHTLPFSSESPWTARKTLKRSFSRDYLEKELNELWNNDFEISLQNITPFSDKKQFWEIILRRISWNRERRQHLFLLLGSHRWFLPLSFSSLVKTCKEILNFFLKYLKHFEVCVLFSNSYYSGLLIHEIGVNVIISTEDISFLETVNSRFIAMLSSIDLFWALPIHMV